MKISTMVIAAIAAIVFPGASAMACDIVAAPVVQQVYAQPIVAVQPVYAAPVVQQVYAQPVVQQQVYAQPVVQRQVVRQKVVRQKVVAQPVVQKVVQQNYVSAVVAPVRTEVVTQRVRRGLLGRVNKVETVRQSF